MRLPPNFRTERHLTIPETGPFCLTYPSTRRTSSCAGKEDHGGYIRNDPIRSLRDDACSASLRGLEASLANLYLDTSRETDSRGDRNRAIDKDPPEFEHIVTHSSPRLRVSFGRHC